MAPAAMDQKKASEYTGVPVSTLIKWRQRGVGPRFVKMERLVRYRVEDLDAYLAANLVGA